MTAALPATAALTFRELLDYTEAETARWAEYFAAHPEALDLPFAGGRTATVRGAVQHVFAVERRYADRLNGEPAAAYDAIPTDPTGEMFAAGRDARARLERFLATASDADLARRHTFETLSAGTQTATARKIVGHALVHGVRTWAQLATVVRQQGVPTEGRHDLLFSNALA